MDLQKERINLVTQRDNAFAVYHQAIGALSLLDALVAEMPNKSSLTIEDLESMTGGKFVGAEQLDATTTNVENS